MSDVTNYTIENASGANVRTDLNNVFAAIQSSNSKSTDLASSQCVAGMPFLNTTTNILKIRNSSNGAFTEIGNIDQANLGLLLKSGGTMTGTLTSQTILPDTDATYDIGSSSAGYNVVHAKATSAQYADLAEIYESDSEYEVGTVVIFGGEKEITVSSMGADPRVAGVISENPAYLMNSKAVGQPVALQGKVPCKVVGQISKGDMLVTHSQFPGVARKGNDPKVGTVIGKALEEYNSTEIGTINIVAGRQ